MDGEIFAFGSFRLIPAQRMLSEDGKPLRLGSGALDFLVALAERPGETISGLAGHGRRRRRPQRPCCGAEQSARRRQCRQALYRHPLWPRLRSHRACDGREREVGSRLLCSSG